MKLYKNIKTHELAELVEEPSQNEENFYRLKYSDGRIENYYKGKFKSTFQSAETINIIIQEERKMELNTTKVGDVVETENSKKESNKKEKEVKKDATKVGKRGRAKTAGDHPLRFTVENHTKEQNEKNDGNDYEVFEAKVPGFRSMKVNSNMYAAMTFNQKGLTLWLRSEAIAGVTIPASIEIKKMNHMFDTRVKFLDVPAEEGVPAVSAATAENIACIHKLLDASIKFQLEKKANTAKAKAAKKAAEKAAKAEEKETRAEVEKESVEE